MYNIDVWFTQTYHDKSTGHSSTSHIIKNTSSVLVLTGKLPIVYILSIWSLSTFVFWSELNSNSSFWSRWMCGSKIIKSMPFHKHSYIGYYIYLAILQILSLFFKLKYFFCSSLFTNATYIKWKIIVYIFIWHWSHTPDCPGRGFPGTQLS